MNCQLVKKFEAQITPNYWTTPNASRSNGREFSARDNESVLIHSDDISMKLIIYDGCLVKLKVNDVLKTGI